MPVRVCVTEIEIADQQDNYQSYLELLRYCFY